jgi:hypothetical protein
MKIDLDKIEQQAKRGLADRTEHPMWPISYPLEPAVVLALVQRIRELEEPSHLDADGNEFEGDRFESEEFYELMQAYRHRPIGDFAGVIETFEAVKAFIRRRE